MLLSSKPLVEKKVGELRERVKKLNITPKLVIIRVGEDPASERYVRNKAKKCEEVGIESLVIHLGEHLTNEDVAYVIDEANRDETVTAVLLQLPLPKHLDEDYLTNLIESNKDVDGFTVDNIGKLIVGRKGNVACTPRGIIDMLKFYDIKIEGKDVLIINRSNIVGKPLAHLFLKENATVTVAHSRTKNLRDKVKAADIVVTAIGRPNMFSVDDFSENTTIIDVSINFDENGKMCGDVTKLDYDELMVYKDCNITPVPGGVGPVTVMSLIEQTIEIAERKGK